MIQETELLQYVYKTAEMGCHGIQSVLDHTKNVDLKDKLRSQQQEYENLRTQAQNLLAAKNDSPNGIGFVAKISSNIMAGGEIMADHSDSKIAEMTTKGNQTGINKTVKHLNDYNGQDTAVRALAEKLLATEQANVEQLKGFL